MRIAVAHAFLAAFVRCQAALSDLCLALMVAEAGSAKILALK
jgi:hypothetical protein